MIFEMFQSKVFCLSLSFIEFSEVYTLALGSVYPRFLGRGILFLASSGWWLS